MSFQMNSVYHMVSFAVQVEKILGEYGGRNSWLSREILETICDCFKVCQNSLTILAAKVETFLEHYRDLVIHFQ